MAKFVSVVAYGGTSKAELLLAEAKRRLNLIWWRLNLGLWWLNLRFDTTAPENGMWTSIFRSAEAKFWSVMAKFSRRRLFSEKSMVKFDTPAAPVNLGRRLLNLFT